jgi:hypothetical protein
MRAERVAAFERNERLVIEVQEMHEHLVHAGSWHVYHCLPAGRCTCETPPTTRKTN